MRPIQLSEITFSKTKIGQNRLIRSLDASFIPTDGSVVAAVLIDLPMGFERA